MGHMLSILGTRPNPARIPGLALWLYATDTASLSFNGTTISQWADRSGKNNHAIQATALRQPKYTADAINGKPALEGRHDGSLLVVADSASLDYMHWTAFAVCKRVTDMGSPEHIAGKYDPTGNNREHRLYITGSDVARAAQGTDGTAVTLVDASTGITPAVGAPFILQADFSASTLAARYNSGVAGTASITSAYNGTSGYVFFTHGSVGDPFAGCIGEYLFYNRALNSSERAQIYAYLSQKWGIT